MNGSGPKVQGPKSLVRRFVLLFWLVLCPIELSVAQQNAAGAQEDALRQAASKTLNSLAVVYYERRDFNKAIAAFQDALKYDPTNEEMRTNLAMVYFQLGSFDKVIETLTEVFNRNQSSQRVLTALAVAHFAVGGYSQAASFYEKLVALAPGDPILRLTLAVAYRLSDRAAKADEILQQLPQNAETQAQYHVILADAYRSRQQLHAAIAEYEKAIALAPNLPEVNYRLGVLHSDLHAYKKAVEAFQRELRINPQSADASYSLGAYFLNYGNDADKARQYFESTVRFNSGHLGGYLELIKIRLGLKQPEEALKLAEKAEAIGSENAELHYLKSRAFNLQGKKELAEKELKRFEELRQAKK